VEHSPTIYTLHIVQMITQPDSVDDLGGPTWHTSSERAEPPPCVDDTGGYDELEDIKVNPILRSTPPFSPFFVCFQKRFLLLEHSKPTPFHPHSFVYSPTHSPAQYHASSSTHPFARLLRAHDAQVRDIPHFSSVGVTLVSLRRRRGAVRGSDLSDVETEDGAPPSRGLLIHFHGGGFVSQTSRTHVPYVT
jgi:hypothetical protein